MLSNLKLRGWQQSCITQALTKYQKPHSHFLCLAAPGAGKTAMAATLAKKLFELNKIDLVICFSPSLIIANDFQNALELHTQKRFCGALGSSGTSLCYHSMQTLGERFWSLMQMNRVFVIFDEIHHCAGDNINTANAWGTQVLINIQGKAMYTLALTGTPWRSDNLPISLANYCENKTHIHCDHIYGLVNAVNDGVCRVPHITALDNQNVTVISHDDTSVFHSFAELLMGSTCTYKDIIEHPLVIDRILSLTKSKLEELRENAPDAGGLIVAASVEHAKQIFSHLANLNEAAVMVTYRESNPLFMINNFKNSKEKWIISVGMISEGTNIPRLQVCCYLSHVKTELYFRQVLGRVMRVNGSTNETGYFFMPAHERLLEYAQRLSEDIPGKVKLKMETMDNLETIQSPYTNGKNISKVIDNPAKTFIFEHSSGLHSQSFSGVQELDKSYNSTINSLGKFSQVVYEL